MNIKGFLKPVFAFFIMLCAVSVNAATLYVTTLNDGVGGSYLNFYETLRKAINNANSGDKIIILPSGRLTLTQGQFNLGAKSLTIEAQNPGDVIIDARGNSRIINISGNGSSDKVIRVTLKNLNLVNGKIFGNGGAILGPRYFNLTKSLLTIENCQFINNQALSLGYGGQGGAISTRMPFEIKNSKFHLNKAANEGGAIRSIGSGSTNRSIEDSLFSLNTATSGTIKVVGTNLTLRDSTLHNNTGETTAGVDFFSGGYLRVYKSTFSYNKSKQLLGVGAGALFVNGATSLIIDNSQFYLNSSKAHAGAIYLDSANSALIRRSSLYSNTANYDGGAIYISSHADNGTFTIENSTISSNVANRNGGGIYKSWGSNMPLKLHHTTVAYNQATFGGGVHANYSSSILAPNLQLEAWNSIIGANSNDDCNGLVYVKGNTILGNGGNCSVAYAYYGVGNTLYGNPGLRPLDYYSSSTKSHALDINSMARDNATLNCILTIDQRGATRPDAVNDGRCDIGAHENQTLLQ